MKLLWIDLETTGLDPRSDEILEVAWAVADLSAPCDVGEVESRVMRFGRDRYVSDFIRDMHTRNGLLAECAESESNVVLAERELLTVVPEVTEREEKTVLAGNSVHFDLGFLRAWMPELAERLSHRVYDVSAVKLYARSLGMPYEKGPEAHRARADVLASIEEAQRIERWFWYRSARG